MSRFLIFISLLICSQVSLGQGAIKKTRSLSDKVFFGGGMGLQFGTLTAIEFSPMVGYTPVNNLYLGLKGKYEFLKNSNLDASTTIYGGSFFAMYAFYQSVVAYGEFEALNLESVYFDPLQIHGSRDRYWAKTPLIGGGFIQPVGERSKILLLLLWNIDESYGSYYSNPIVRVSFLF